MKIEKNSKIVIASEILFILLPIFILLIYLIINDKVSSIFYSYDLSFATIILFGQTIVKMASGISNREKRFVWQYISLIFTLIIVLGLIPSILILIFLLIGYKIFCLYIAQLILLIISLIIYFIFGTIGQMFLDEKKSA